MKSAEAARSVPEAYSDDVDLLEIIRTHPCGNDERQAAFQVLVTRYRWLVRACAQPYRGGPEAHEDLMQVGYLGLVKAITYFDPDVGRSLAAYARHVSAVRSSGISGISAGKCTLTAQYRNFG